MNKTPTAESLTDAEIVAFRAELLQDSFARNTDAPYACLRALKPARGKNQKAARVKARATVAAAIIVWNTVGKNGVAATLCTLST